MEAPDWINILKELIFMKTDENKQIVHAYAKSLLQESDYRSGDQTNPDSEFGNPDEHLDSSTGKNIEDTSSPIFAVVWQMWLKLSREHGIEDYEISSWNHYQINNLINELNWVQTNVKKFRSYQDLSDAFGGFLDQLSDQQIGSI
jgi:hypothetical protein